MSKVIISRILPHLAALDNENPGIEMVQEEERSFIRGTYVSSVHYDITYTFRLSHNDFVKAFEE